MGRVGSTGESVRVPWMVRAGTLNKIVFIYVTGTPEPLFFYFSNSVCGSADGGVCCQDQSKADLRANISSVTGAICTVFGGRALERSVEASRRHRTGAFIHSAANGARRTRGLISQLNEAARGPAMCPLGGARRTARAMAARKGDAGHGVRGRAAGGMG